MREGEGLASKGEAGVTRQRIIWKCWPERQPYEEAVVTHRWRAMTPHAPRTKKLAKIRRAA